MCDTTFRIGRAVCGAVVRHLGRPGRWLRWLDAGGAAAVEFAIVGSCFVMMLLAAFEFGYMLFVQSALDNAARDAARLIRTGQAQNSSNATTTFQTLLCNEVSTIIGCSNIVYQAQVFNNWTAAQSAVNTPPQRNTNGTFVSAGFSAGTAGQIMVVTATYNYPFLTPWIASLLGGGSDTALLMSTVVFQNEPY
ncbi:MAG TPA: TadE/TadG family type IV pilus assembly protein [Stellaceae bacterium]|nr:TadE/TadG family type IV pilus assembly protein [Stellaceae bacterium]